MKTGAKEEHLGRHIERQMGCMTGFFQIFDRHQIYAAKRLASFPSPAASCSSASERSDSSISSCKDLPAKILPEIPPRRSLPLPLFDVKEGRSSWKFKDAPRLSLDSRVDSRSKIRSPSVVGKLMGLDALPCNTSNADVDKKTELRRSVSESRVPRDNEFIQSDLIFENKLREVRRCIIHEGKQRSQSPKSFFDSQEYFLAEPLKKPAENLESLKHVLEVFQLKGLLHSNREQHQNPIVVMKSAPRSPSPRLYSPAIEQSPTDYRRKPNPAKIDRTRRSGPTETSGQRSPLSPSRKQNNPPNSPRSTITKNTKTRIPCSNATRFDSEMDGRLLLERCDKLLSSIAEITSKTVHDYEAEQHQQPSPVSVLDASTDFADDDVAYIAEILPRASLMRADSYRKSLPLQQRLFFDAVKEIAGRRSEVPPWESFRSSRAARMMETDVRPEEVWTELRRLQERAPGEGQDLCEVIGGVLRKDLDGPFDASAEISDAVLDIERLVYKDLVGEAIRELAACCARRRRRLLPALPRRRLMF